MKITKLDSLAHELVKNLCRDMNADTIGLKEVEEQIVRFTNMIGHELIQMVLNATNEPTKENAITVKQKTARYRATESVTLKDRFGGDVTIHRRRYSITGGGSVYPLDERIGITRCFAFTPLMTYLQALFGAGDPYQISATRLSAALGFGVSATAVEHNTEGTGACLERRPRRLLEGRDEACDLMHIEMDGTMSPQIKEEQGITGRASVRNPTEYKECNVGVVEKYRKGIRIDRWTGAQYGPRADFETYFGEAGPALGQHAATRTVFIADGAHHNWAFCSTHFPYATQILDFYHATEHLSKFCALYPNAAIGKAVFITTKTLVYEGQTVAAIAELRRAVTRFVTPASREEGRKEIAYFETNQNRMEYDRYRTEGLPIGSGLIEGSCKLVVGKRFKGNGMRWKKADNENTLATRLAVINGTLESEFRPKKQSWRPHAA